MVAVHDTIREVTTITVQTNDAGDTVKVVQITDRDRARNREAVRDKEERLVVKTDTVYVEKRDSTSVSSFRFQDSGGSLNPHPSSLHLTLKWIFWILIGLIGLIVTVKICHRR